MALDEALLESVAVGSAGPTLRLYGWRPRAVSIGYSQILNDSVDPYMCRKHGVDVVRRMTGGGTVFHDRELTYSVVTSERVVPRGVQESFEFICEGIVAGLKRLGVEAGISSSNDIIVGGAKVSGNAQLRRRGHILQHGSVFLNLDQGTMSDLLIEDGKGNKGGICMPEGRVICLKDLGVNLSFQEVSKRISRGFETALGLRLREDEPTEKEIERRDVLSRKKYETAAWNER